MELEIFRAGIFKNHKTSINIVRKANRNKKINTLRKYIINNYG